MTRNEHSRLETADGRGSQLTATGGGARLFRRLQRLEHQCANRDDTGGSYSPTQHRRDCLRSRLYDPARS
jgi:hypothetical protein